MSFSNVSLDDVLAIVQDAARRELLPRFLSTTLAQRDKTSAFDIVTDADEAMEATMAVALARRFPDAIILGEEACSRRPALLDALPSHALAFVIDPLDGTRNFANGLPLFGVMVAVLSRGATVAGLIHDPITGMSLRAVAGGGAWACVPGQAAQRLQVSTPRPAAQMDCIVSTTYLPQPLRDATNARLSRVGRTSWYGCAAHEYRLAAAGLRDAMFYQKLMPWDHAAGVLIHREAGGFSAMLDGSPYSPARHDGGLICAADAASWQAVRDALFG